MDTIKSLQGKEFKERQSFEKHLSSSLHRLRRRERSRTGLSLLRSGGPVLFGGRVGKPVSQAIVDQ